MLVGLVRNPLSHANRGGRRASIPPGVLAAEPESREVLALDLARLAGEGVELLAVDGGDGTIRDVISALPQAFGDRPPLLALTPTGKTNILAFDLGVPRGWPLEAALAAAKADRPAVKTRAPLQLDRGVGSVQLLGFVLGAAGFVRATAFAQGLHRGGAFSNTAVALALAGGVAKAVAGGEGGWREGDPLSLAVDGGAPRAGARLVFMATTLERLPFAMRPFGPARPGLKYLDIDAPPRSLAARLPGLLWGRGGLLAEGYRRGPAGRLALSLPGEFVLDGETYAGGALTITQGAPLRFLVP